MPYKSAEARRQHDREYCRRRTQEDPAARMSCEREVLTAIRLFPSQFDVALLYEYFDGKYTFARIVKVVKNLLREGYGDGLIEYDRSVRGSKKLRARVIPIVTLILPPAPPMTENGS